MKTFNEFITILEAFDEVGLSLSDKMKHRKNHKAGKKIKIDNEVYNWAKKKFGGGGSVEITKQNIAIDKQKITIDTKTKNIIIAPYGELISVDITPSNSNKSKTTFFEKV